MSRLRNVLTIVALAALLITALSEIVYRHAAEMLANFRVKSWLPLAENPVTPNPAADPVWGKGQEFGGSSDPEWIYRLRITRPADPDTIVSRRIDIAVSRRYEFIFVGSNAGNARIVLLNRQISQPSLYAADRLVAGEAPRHPGASDVSAHRAMRSDAYHRSSSRTRRPPTGTRT